jgi:hypothetical protein
MIKMKCAVELQLTAKVRAAEIAVEEEERKRQARKALRGKTILFCEQLGKVLESKADKGVNPIVSFYYDSFSGVMEQTHKDYADHRLSYRKTGLDIDLEYLAEWFNQYCFKVSIKSMTVWRYGWGQTDIQLITVSPAPQCIQ